MNCRLKVKEDVIAELHGNVLKKDEEIASLRSLLDEQKNKNNVRSSIFLPPIGNFENSFGFEQSMRTIKIPQLQGSWLPGKVIITIYFMIFVWSSRNR